MIQGDHNTSFYHISTLARRKRNLIASVKNDRGEWLTEAREVMEHFRMGFIDLYTTSQLEVPWTPFPIDHWQVQLSEEAKLAIDSMITPEEIKEALWSMQPYKALGPNGLHVGFFQRFWLLVGDSVRKEVKNVFRTRKVPDYLNKTHIVLIPKIQGPESIRNYRPISLWRRGADNAIIVQELVHTIGKMKGNKGAMAIKVDLEKAYDKIEWSFIREMLVKFNFPQNLIKLIMSCVSSVSTSILFNGGCLETFSPSRGIRQGDPLSPYLFILCMEYLGYLIEEKCNARLWNPIKASRSGPAFSHLFFADDLVLFANADMENCIAVNDVLQKFCAKSGQKVSASKTRVFFSPNVDADLKDYLTNLLGFDSTTNLDPGPIRSLVQGPLTLEASNLTIKDVIGPCGWNWAAIPFYVPPEIKEVIQVVPTPIVVRNGDKMAWKHSAKGGFDMKSAYLLATNPGNIGNSSGIWIWKLHTLPRIQMFIWRCFHYGIGVKECLARRGIPIDTTCPLYQSETETIMHALRDCSNVQTIWQQLGVQSSNNAFFDQDFRTWLKVNATLKSTQNPKNIPWYVLFPFAIWPVWKQRNQTVFNNRRNNPSLVKQIIMQAMEFIHCVSHPNSCRRLSMNQIRWERPGKGRLKLNTDGAASITLSLAGGGGLIRDELGNWVIGFSKRIGSTNSFMAEDWALRDGLLLCNPMNLSDIIVEIDAKALVNAFNNPTYDNSVISPLFDDCRQLASRI
ncbi:uncharacterized protein LOC142622815 [Castanea sativa]|uniref:uncharacterized protein LOC142622815 n=1 Tax=Castanea sativa TaxID=21020 RepID=UPI003F6495B1